MKASMVIAILLIVVGVIALGYQGYVWVNGTEEVARIGPVHVERQRSFPVPVAPIVGGVALVAGIIMAMRSSSRAAA